MKINLDVVAVSLDGSAIRDGELENSPPLKLSKFIANRMWGMEAKEVPLKVSEWARTLYATGVLDLDGDDQERFRILVQTSLRLPVWAVGPAIQIMNDAKAETEKPAPKKEKATSSG